LSQKVLFLGYFEYVFKNTFLEEIGMKYPSSSLSLTFIRFTSKTDLFKLLFVLPSKRHMFCKVCFSKSFVVLLRTSKTSSYIIAKVTSGSSPFKYEFILFINKSNPPLLFNSSE